jgi:hypothetical protein
MTQLNFPEYNFRITETDGKRFIFDPVRKKYVVLTPEEWVRQHVIQFLISDKNVPVSLIIAEAEISLFKTKKRFDIAVYDRNGNALMVVECKAPTVPLSQDVLDQAVRYNMTLKVGILMLTNGLQHIFCRVDPSNGAVKQISDLPVYPFSH